METGRVINQYKVISAIGKSGTGEVYRASDPKIGRDVTIKVRRVMKILNALAAAAVLVIAAQTSAAQESLSYAVNYSPAKPAIVRVTIRPSVSKKGHLTLVIPRAIPSGYAQQFYDRYVENVKAISVGERPVAVAREDGPRWRLGDAQTAITQIEYDVDLGRLEREITSASDTSKARANYVGILGYTVFGYVEGAESLPINLEIKGPGGWPIFTTLAPKDEPDKARAIGRAENFFELADSQIAMGAFELRRLKARVPFYFLSYSEVATDLAKQGEVIEDAFAKVAQYFGDIPFRHYTAYVEILKPLSERHEYGFSMEHLDSSTYFLGTDRAYTAATTTQQVERDRFNFVHHISHSWIPKRVYGKGYLPFTWELAPQIETIWFNEGFARFISMEALFDAMPATEGREFRARQIESWQTTVASMPALIRNMPLTELSRVGSLMYSDDFRTGRTLFSKGALLALEMDQKIRELTGGKRRFRDSLRSLVQWGIASNRPFRAEELPGLIAKPAGIDESAIREIMIRWNVL